MTRHRTRDRHEAAARGKAPDRKLVTVPAEAAEAGKLAARYASEALGEIA